MTTQQTSRFAQAYQSTRINKDEKLLTAAQAIHQAGLDWNVETFPIYYKNSRGNYKEIQNRWTKATVRTDSGACLGVVGHRYQPIQNKDLFTFFDEVVKTKDACYTGAGQFLDGRMVWLQARLPKDIVIAREDVIEKNITLITSHDGTFPMMISLIGHRLFCLNQLKLVREGKQMVVRHTQNFRSKTTEARRILGLSLNFFQEFEEKAKAMAAKKLTVAQATDFFSDFLEVEKDPTDREQEKINSLLNLFEKGKGNDRPAIRHSVWAAYNALTEHADHFSDVRSAEDDQNNYIRNAWIGTGSRLKLEALDKAMELVVVRK